MWIVSNNISLGVSDKGFRMSVGKESYMSSLQNTLFMCTVIQYAPIKARTVLLNLGRSFGGSHRAVAACEVKKVSGGQQLQIPLW
jgi:hypothetical protein